MSSYLYIIIIDGMKMSVLYCFCYVIKKIRDVYILIFLLSHRLMIFWVLETHCN